MCEFITLIAEDGNYEPGLAGVLATELGALCEIRRQVFHWSANHEDLLPSNLPLAYVAGENRAVLPHRRCCRRSGVSPVLALPPGVLSWNSRMGWHAKHGFASIAPDRRNGFARRRHRSSGGTYGNGV